jgi:DedD protein
MAQDDKYSEKPGGSGGKSRGDAVPDETTPLKKRARRRLIGAVALALLAAIVLPMVMDHQPAPPLRDIQVRIPSPDEGLPQRVPVSPAPAVAAPVEPVAPVVPPIAEPEIKPSPPKPEARTGDDEFWEVQLGAYQNPASVTILVGKLKQLGLPTYTETVETPNGPRTRVRAGPFPSQEAAERARVRVKIVGVDGPVAKKQ